MHTLIQESCSVVFKHFSVLLAACVISVCLENLFYIDINKNVISYFNTRKLLFVILLPISCKKMKHPIFHFWKRLEDKLWLGVGLGRCDRQTVVGRGVNLSLLRRSFCKRRVQFDMNSNVKINNSDLIASIKMQISKENKSHQLSVW